MIRQLNKNGCRKTHFIRENIWMDEKHLKRDLTSLVIKKMKLKLQWDYKLVRIAKIRKIGNTKNW